MNNKQESEAGDIRQSNESNDREQVHLDHNNEQNEEEVNDQLNKLNLNQISGQSDNQPFQAHTEEQPVNQVASDQQAEQGELKAEISNLSVTRRSSPNGSRHRPTTPAITDSPLYDKMHQYQNAVEAFNEVAKGEEVITYHQIQKFLSQCSVKVPKHVVDYAIRAVVDWEQNPQEFTLDDCLAVYGLLKADSYFEDLPPLGSPVSTTRIGPSNQCRYQRSGDINKDKLIQEYIKNLQQHKKKCELEGRYIEAKATQNKINEVKGAQAERLKQELIQRHKWEHEEVLKSFQTEQEDMNNEWEERIREHDEQFQAQIEGLRQLHSDQIIQFRDKMREKRPTRPQYSRELLNQRKIQVQLAKQGLYNKAQQVKKAANELEKHEMRQKMAQFQAESRLKESRLQQRQALEVDAQLQKGARARDELELQRKLDITQRTKKEKNVINQLTTLHKVQIAHLENFLEGQQLAGKRSPTKSSHFKRKTGNPAIRGSGVFS